MLGEDSARRRSRRFVVTGAPPWMATFADLSTLLLSFFVLLLSFSEMDIEKYKQIAGSMRSAFGVQVEHFAKEAPKGTSFVAREFSPGKPDPSPLERIQQITDDIPQPYLDVVQEGIPDPTRDANSDAFRGPLSADEEAARETLEKVRELLSVEIERGLVEVEQRGVRVIIRVRERGSFASGSAELIEPFTPVIRKIGEAIALTDSAVVVAGHSDDVPIRNARFRSNWELSAARAVTLVQRLEGASRLDRNRITVKGHADTRPLVANDSALNRARNRRVEVILVHGQGVERERSVDDFLNVQAEASKNG